ncbi:uncharacterized protein BT62DRAFT_929843 [Guyanagaster necrorhizus]|uniref:GDP/GTP exchange factor Sec2 N-terminal domain-containing protein n=1 Tax=Guyanagaster necrorhizus TaxID=856835 RepID=A0A9P7VXW1_9AGAR|nr:uncharacterized protein BT62DRAFT_929843 [Guyanagaster necrorhizus MCA 3950]KAG7448750.1 hypothetical protein BT62DRAFT_929843 [Guyanagaster necrorhizus MCA 3950]
MAPDSHDEWTTSGTTSTHTDRPTGRRPRYGSESDAQEMVIQSLRTQIQDLYSQVTELNTKLVKSYDRVSDLEDDLHVTSTNLRSSTLKLSELEFERTQHLSALNTGLLVEKSNVTAELNRLMEKATEEAAQRGQAETARATIEKELDDLSASLFDQANTMVAEARYSKALSEQKVEEAEIALKGAEEAVAVMQQQMQALQADKEEADKRALEIRVSMGKGKWAERREDGSLWRPLRLICSHLPYQEFLLFVAHLRTLHISTPTPPTMSTLLPLPFIARLLSEDSEPAVRLDLAPSLNWLSRRSVLAAIYNGQLTIEPISSSYLLQDAFLNAPSISGLSSNNIVCALCGESVFPNSESRPSGSGSWPSSLFKKPLSYTLNGSNGSNSVPPSPKTAKPAQVHIFRVSSSTSPSSALPNLSIPTASFISTSSQSQASGSAINHHSNGGTQSTTAYALCTSGWCLMRLRQTCTLWAFVRTGIVERVWEEEVPALPPPPIPTASNGDKPPVPPRRRGLWGMASALGERAVSWSSDDKEKKKLQQEKEKEKKFDLTWERDQAKAMAQNEKLRGKKFAPPPVHPSLSAGPKSPPVVAPAPVPPPLPRRNDRRPVPPPPPTAAKEVEPPTLERPQTPTRVPLPESRPATPATPASPAAPPPLPRRAAARGARPLPGSRPGTPKSEGAAKEKSEEKEKEKEKKAQDNDRENEESDAKRDEKAETEVGKEGENVEKEVEESTAEERPSVPSEVPTTEPVSASETVTEPYETSGSEPELSSAVEVEESPPTTLISEGAEQARPSSSESIESDTPSSPTPSHVYGKVELEDRNVSAGYDDEQERFETPVQSVSESDDGKEEPEDETKEVYIGDTTWEERTWKELIRIKEDMFWARVGGLR